MGIFGGLLNKFDGGIEILDDLDDHWYSITSFTQIDLLQDGKESQKGFGRHFPLN